MEVKEVKGESTFTLPKANARVFYRRYLELLQPMLKLRKREADVFAEILYFNYEKRYIVDKEDRARLVFDISTRKKIQEYLGVSNDVIQQALAGLRKKEYIVGTRIKALFDVLPTEGVFSLTFKFLVSEEG